MEHTTTSEPPSTTTTDKSSMAGSKAGDNLGRGVMGAAASVHVSCLFKYTPWQGLMVFV
jgi:hypothetical protein